MPYIPNAEDALVVYILAVAYFDDIPPILFNPSHSMNVKELVIKGEFYIWDEYELDIDGRYKAPLAVCNYDKKSETWTVELNSGQLVAFRDLANVWELVRVKSERDQDGDESPTDDVVMQV
jgi:hypothetical protein